ncbi:MAG: hypothetical protein P1U68_14415 [Verrucomicrobiales bacterium]|nr:hypothetical protein [Verrucomicrobiales bacterium]
MPRFLLSLLLPQIFLALSLGSTVSSCQAAWAGGIDLHADHHCHGDHDHEDEKSPCDGQCESLIEDATTSPHLRLPGETAPVDLPFSLFASKSESSFLPVLSKFPPDDPVTPPSPPVPVLTGCFLI